MTSRRTDLLDISRAAKRDQKNVDSFKSEIKRIFGDAIDVDRPLSKLMREVLDMSDDPRHSIEFSGVKPSVSISLMESARPEFRIFAARVAPVRFVDKLASDPSVDVRHEVAKRVSVRVLDGMIKRWPRDDQLREVARKRGLLIVELKKSGGYEKVGDPMKQWEGPKLSDVWYEQQAENLMKKFMNNIEYMWEETAVRQFANAMRATNGTEVDEKKLYDVLKKKIYDRETERLEALDDEPLREQPLKETIEWLKLGGHRSLIVPVIEHVEDPVLTLLEKRVSNRQYVREFESLFEVKTSPVPSALRKYGIDEMTVPVKATVPNRKPIGVVEEKALDKYVSCWNSCQSTEPIKLSWDPSTFDCDVSFRAVLR